MITMNKKISITHLPNVDSFEKQKLLELIYSHYDKLNSKLQGELTLGVHFKEIRRDGERKLVETKVKVTANGVSLNASFNEWEAEKSLHKVLQAIEKEAEKVKK